ncbi:MAG: hypothetical protein IJY39_07440 [Clostridia bacterium]|nr:hypothetical protein [Clostridia bacterium]
MMRNEHRYKFAILGGDRRQAVIADSLISRGHRVCLYGLGDMGTGCKGAEICSSFYKAIEKSDVIILPLPVTRNNLDLSLPSAAEETVKLADVVKAAKKYECKTVLGGMIPDEIMRLCEVNGISAFDYYKSEDLQRKNALPSAEGALMIAMEHTDVTVRGMKALVCGYGRIGTVLTGLLDKLGAEVSVAARRDEALCEIALNGYRAVRLGGDSDELRRAAEESDVIFNTVPHVILTENILKGFTNKPLYIEVASSPGGIDLAAARDVGIRTVFAPSLPGKYSPVSAGKYIFETISDILEKGGINI